MVDTKISALTLDATPDTADEIALQRGGTSNFKTSVANLLATSHNHPQSDITNLTTDLAAKEATANKNAVNGYAGLNGSSKLTGTQQVYGSAANTAAEGNDLRLSDARTPLAHTHNASTDIDAGTLPIARGGTNLSAIGTALQLLRVNAGATALEYADPAAGGNPLWEVLGSTKLAAAGDTLEVAGFTPKTVMQILVKIIPVGTVDTLLRFNSDAGPNYASRLATTGGYTAATASANEILTDSGIVTEPFTVEGIIFNTSGLVKTADLTTIQPGASSAASPLQVRLSGCWHDIANQISTISFININSGSFDVDSEITVLGRDF